MNYNPGLYVFEGADGVGKTSTINCLYDLLRAKNVEVEKFGFPGYEPDTLGNLIYRIHNSEGYNFIDKIEPVSLQLMHIAAHIDSIVKFIRPAYNQRKVILLDRFWWSTVIYGLTSGVEADVLQQLLEIEKHYWGKIHPTRIYLITRALGPLKKVNIEKWHSINCEYKNLSNREKNGNIIKVVSNDTTLSDCVSQIMNDILT